MARIPRFVRVHPRAHERRRALDDVEVAHREPNDRAIRPEAAEGTFALQQAREPREAPHRSYNVYRQYNDSERLRSRGGVSLVVRPWNVDPVRRVQFSYAASVRSFPS